jgi:hypothetical protein
MLRTLYIRAEEKTFNVLKKTKYMNGNVLTKRLNSN